MKENIFSTPIYYDKVDLNKIDSATADTIMAAVIAGASAAVSAIQNALEDAPFPFMSKIPKG